MTQSPSPQDLPPDSGGQSPGAGDTPPPMPPPGKSDDVRLWCALAHFSGLAGLMFPCGNIVGPIVVWMVKKDEIPAVIEHARLALNFHITIFAAVLILVAVAFVTFGFGACISVPVIVGLCIFEIVMSVVAGIKAYEGGVPTYPLSYKFV